MLNKKAAMFGLVSRRSRQGFSQSRALKKQFGKLFLVRMQSVDSQETRGACIQTNRAAMFGLDARIALAIFGALSVISGAALYSAIQNAKVTAIIVELDEIDKAATQYLLDTGSYLPYRTADVTKADVDLGEVMESTKDGWKGPYLSYDRWSADDNWLVHPQYELVMIHAATDSNWSDATPSATGTKCLKTSTSCSLYSCFRGLSDDLKKALEEAIDGTSGSNDTGSVRYKLGAGEYTCKRGSVFPTSLAIN